MGRVALAGRERYGQVGERCGVVVEGRALGVVVVVGGLVVLVVVVVVWGVPEVFLLGRSEERRALMAMVWLKDGFVRYLMVCSV